MVGVMCYDNLGCPSFGFVLLFGSPDAAFYCCTVYTVNCALYLPRI